MAVRGGRGEAQKLESSAKGSLAARGLRKIRVLVAEGKRKAQQTEHVESVGYGALWMWQWEATMWLKHI